MIEVRLAEPWQYSWIAQQAMLTVTPDFRALSAYRQGIILGMVGFDGWTPNSCCVHIALQEPIALRRLAPKAFAMIWESGRTVALASVLSNNTRSLRLTRHLGFREKTLIHDGYAKGVGIHIFEMRQEHCRWG